MMNKVIAGVCLALLMPRLAWSDSRTVDGRTWSYSVSGGEATIEKVLPDTGDLSIPASLGAYPVTRVAESAFEGCSRLRSVTFPTNLVEKCFSVSVLDQTPHD